MSEAHSARAVAASACYSPAADSIVSARASRSALACERGACFGDVARMLGEHRVESTVISAQRHRDAVIIAPGRPVTIGFVIACWPRGVL
jgi:hypothetical protein